MASTYNTVFCLKKATFSVASVPFNIAPTSFTLTSNAVLQTLHLKADPIKNLATWENDLLAGEKVRFEGTKAGSTEVIQADVQATKDTSNEEQNHWIISFTIVPKHVQEKATT